MEQGNAAEFKGKNLDEIEINMDEVGEDADARTVFPSMNDWNVFLCLTCDRISESTAWGGEKNWLTSKK